MRAEQDRPAGPLRAAKHRSDAVDLGLQPGVLELPHEPFAGVEIDPAQGPPYDAVAEPSEVTDFVQ